MKCARLWRRASLTLTLAARGEPGVGEPPQSKGLVKARGQDVLPVRREGGARGHRLALSLMRRLAKRESMSDHREESARLMSAVITSERPDSADAVALIAELEAELDPRYPPESRHGYSVEKLLAQAVAFFVLRDHGVPAGCGGIQLFGAVYGELKRMYVRPEFRGRRFGEMLLDHLADYALNLGVRLLRLETGIYQDAAMRLYERTGFQRIPPFGEYMVDPLSLFYEKRIM